MLRSKVILGAAAFGLLGSSSLSADIYDDYKLIAKGITINSQKVQMLNTKLIESEEQNKLLKESITKMQMQIEQIMNSNGDGSCGCSHSNNNELLGEDLRGELLKIIEDGNVSR